MRRERRERAFTLFEVMAAVLVLGMLYAVLANAAMQGLQSEGETRRRLQASLIADRALAEIETQLSLGVIPRSGVEEEEQDPFLVRVTIEPFDPSVLLPPPKDGEPEPRAATPDVPTLLGPPTSADAGRLRRIDVLVVWSEAGEERRAGRTTFAFDTTGLDQLFPPEAETGQAEQTPAEPTEEDLRGLSPQEAVRKMQNMLGQPGGGQ